jgi:deoxyribodipyrimidine photolyase-related protein
MRCFVLFPNTLFEFSFDTLLLYDKVCLLEDSIFFTQYPNVLKSAYLFSSMYFYKDYLKTKKIILTFIDSREKFLIYLKKHSVTHLSFFNPTDYNIKSYLYDLCHKHKYKLKEYDTLMFLLKESEINEKIYYSNATFMKKFNWGKSYDSENRNKLPSNVLIPEPLKFRSNKYYLLGCNRAKKLHNVDIIDIDVLLYYPVTFSDSKTNLYNFLTTRLNKFGTYQDSIDINSPFLFHSNISSSLNIGLLTPDYVYKTIMLYVQNNKDVIGINNVEGFLRQVLGWREYIRYIYINFSDDLQRSNIWNSTNKLKWEYWNGDKKTGIEFLDIEILKCKKYSYSHHIVRLMIFLNIFVLLNIDPNEILKWFMCICSIDAYHWCMIPNIWAMGYYDPRFMHKPYISTSNYITKMSNYNKDKTFDALFYNFLNNKKDIIKKYAGIYLRNLSYYDRLTENEKFNINKIANSFITKCSRKN